MSSGFLVLIVNSSTIHTIPRKGDIFPRRGDVFHEVWLTRVIDRATAAITFPRVALWIDMRNKRRETVNGEMAKSELLLGKGGHHLDSFARYCGFAPAAR